MQGLSIFYSLHSSLQSAYINPNETMGRIHDIPLNYGQQTVIISASSFLVPVKTSCKSYLHYNILAGCINLSPFTYSQPTVVKAATRLRTLTTYDTVVRVGGRVVGLGDEAFRMP